MRTCNGSVIATCGDHVTLLGDTDMTPKSGQIRIGIGGWTFEPWRGVFYPQGLPHTQELRYASERLSSIEVNGTFYRTQTPATFEMGERLARTALSSHSRVLVLPSTAVC